ncbi:MAG TPA: HlyD family efflux transporter periplasmic adaptor subunit [Blastocatellia bacterium]|nr:HlyD family efflux transporter periplasmic adaptor subunit [Blastocatellia bacterium]
MAIPFSRSTRSLNADSYRRSTFGLITVMLVVAAWVVWLFAARVALYEVTNAARLEVDTAAHPVESPVAGRVIATHLQMGKQVQAGDVLVELDGKTERLQLNEEQTQLSTLSAQLDVLRNEIAAETRSLDQTEQATPLTLAQARARHEEAESAARQATEEVKQLTRLNAQGLVSDLVLLRAKAEAEKTRTAADALQLEVSRVEKDQGAKATDRQARIENLKRQVAMIEGDAATRRATIERLQHAIDRRLVLAPATGKLGEIAELRVGSVVREGDKLGAVLPAGTLRVVAEFLPSAALGRIQPGQQARLRLEGFPWTEYGGVRATVANVAGEPRDGRVRVELTINADPSSLIPLQHGLPGTVEIEVERVSPAQLCLRAAGKRLTGVVGQAESPASDGK